MCIIDMVDCNVILMFECVWSKKISLCVNWYKTENSLQRGQYFSCKFKLPVLTISDPLCYNAEQIGGSVTFQE